MAYAQAVGRLSRSFGRGARSSVSSGLLPALLVVCATSFAARAAAEPSAAAHSTKARVENFALLDHEGRFHELYYHSDAKAIVLFVHQNGCPIVRNALPALRELRDELAPRGVIFWLLDASPQDDRARVAEEAREFAIDFPVLLDETQLVAESLGVSRTAEALLIDPRSWRIAYRGPLDDRLGYESQKPRAKRSYLREALEAQLAGRPVAVEAPAALGCLILLDDAAREKRGSISYREEIAPLLQRRCQDCHRPAGVAPWAMTDYAMVRGWSAMMREMIRTRRMPPWQADPHVQHFANDLSLSPREAKTLVHWIEAGAPRGDGPDPLAEAPPPEPPEWPLGLPDRVVAVPGQTLPATGVIDYRYEVVDLGLREDVWLRAVDIRPSNPRAMHHGTAFIVFPPGHERSGPPETRLTDGLFAGYVPGRRPLPLPEDAGFHLPAGSSVRFQLHYTATGRPEVDAPRLALYFSERAPRHELRYGAAANYRFAIPPGAKEYEASAARRLERDIVVYRLVPHMHLRGKRMRIEAEYPDGTQEVLLSVPNYSFNWQHHYVLAEPKTLPAGTRVVAHAAFDNSAQNPWNPDPDRTVSHGEQSFDEMLMGYYLYRLATPEEDRVADGGS